MKINTLFSFFAAGVLSLTQVSADEHLKGCGTHTMTNKLMKEHPELVPQMMKVEQEMHSILLDQMSNGLPKSNQTYIVPIVFHIIHNYGEENISDAQVLDCVRIINEDFTKTNSDTNLVVPGFQNLIGDADIEFRLATIDPDGNCTNGIDRIASPKTYQADDNSKLNPWPRHKYLNVWVINSMSNPGVAGYAYKPSGSASGMMFLVDGIILLHSYVGSIGTSSPGRGRTLTHEIGHWLGLDHPWGPTNEPGVSCGDDGIPDTPITEGWTTCNLNGATCGSTLDNVQNYMEYSYCSRMFTEGQCFLMRLTLQNSVSDRNNLSTQANLIATGTATPSASVCSPIADFSSNRWVVCSGQNITFSDESYNGPVTSRTWTFSGGSPATSSAATQVVSFASPGWHEISLSVSNAAGSSSITRSTYIYVKNNAADFMGPYVEPFSDEVQYNWYYQNRNYGNDSRYWRYTSDYGYNANGCIMMNSFGSLAGEVDEIITPAINLDYISSPKLNFYYTCGSNTSIADNMDDQLRLYVSTDCGVTWTQRLLLEDDALQNGGSSVNPYFPVNNPTWELRSVTLPASTSAPNVLFKFEYRAGNHPNNLFIDDINVTGVLSDKGRVALTNGFVLQPNPASDVAILTTSLNKPGRVLVEAHDVLGKRVARLFDADASVGAVQIPINTEQLGAKGVYMITLTTPEGQFTKRLVKE